ncbi:MAG: MFS transporter [Henriciella sp.]
MKSGETNKYRWYTVIMLSAVYACSQLDRQIMGILLDPIAKDLGANDTQMGFLVGLTFAVFYTFLAIPIAMIADRTNRKNVIAISVVAWSGMTAVCGLVSNFAQMALARIGVAVGEAGSSPSSVSIISDLFDEKSRATALSVFVVGANVGVLIAFLGGGILLDNYGWRTTFIVVGLPGVLLGLLVYLTVPEPKKALVDGKPKSGASFKETFWHMVKVPALRHVLIGKALGAFVGYGFILWIPTFLVRSHGLTGTQIGFTLAMFAGLGGAVGTLMSGRVVDYLGKRDERWRAWAISVSKLVPIPFLVSFLLLDQFLVAVIFYIVPSILGSFYLAPSTALVQNLVTEPMRTVASAISMFLLNIIGMGFGPQGVGILSDFLAPAYGEDSLRYALAAFTVVNIWGAYHFWRAGVLIGRDGAAMQAVRSA